MREQLKLGRMYMTHAGGLVIPIAFLPIPWARFDSAIVCSVHGPVLRNHDQSFVPNGFSYNTKKRIIAEVPFSKLRKKYVHVEHINAMTSIINDKFILENPMSIITIKRAVENLGLTVRVNPNYYEQKEGSHGYLEVVRGVHQDP